jgi:N6-adenosine-specific RNA methylase IME4
VTGTAVAVLKYDQACRALEEARSLDEVKGIADKVEALRVYARQAKNRELEINAAEIRIRAERRMGELLTAQKAGKGLATGTRGQLKGSRASGGSVVAPPEKSTLTLDELGISRKLSARSQAIAAVPVKAFETRIATWRAGVERDGEKVTLAIVRGETKREHRASREVELAKRIKALPDRRYGVVLADPEWRFEVRSRVTGLDRSADNHYPTSSLEEIARRPVASIAAPDCALFLWATMPHLAAAIAIMAGWGFVYRSHIVWRKAEVVGSSPAPVGRGFIQHGGKVVLGTGYWFRGAHELLLLGTCGSVPAPAPGTQWPSVVDHPPLRHSEKPAIFHALIEQYFPTVPKIELNARVARPGWDAWGLEAPDGEEGK